MSKSQPFCPICPSSADQGGFWSWLLSLLCLLVGFFVIVVFNLQGKTIILHVCSFYNSGSNKILRALSEIFSYYFILMSPSFLRKSQNNFFKHPYLFCFQDKRNMQKVTEEILVDLDCREAL